jgi:hypothetical protein
MRFIRAAWLLVAVCGALSMSTIGAAAQEMDGWATLLTAGPGPVSAIVPDPDWPNDRLILALRGAGGQATDGDVGCASEPTLGFGRVWSSEPDVRTTLGCPTGPERAVQIRYRPDGLRRDLWPEDDSDVWFNFETRSDLAPYYQRRSKQTDGASFQFTPSEVGQGAIQEFSGGVLIFLVETDGRRTIFMLGSGTEAREFPD